MSEPRSEAERLAKVIWKLAGIKACIDLHEEFFEMHERELADEIINIVSERVKVMLERSKP